MALPLLPELCPCLALEDPTRGGKGLGLGLGGAWGWMWLRFLCTGGSEVRVWLGVMEVMVVAFEHWGGWSGVWSWKGAVAARGGRVMVVGGRVMGKG